MADQLVKKIEINVDCGEGFGRWKMGPDEELMPFIDTANIACGFHAGDPAMMVKMVRLCKKYGVKVGAHPGLPDLIGFGRRRMELDPHDVYCAVLYQVGALKAILDAEGVPLIHIKPHGELGMWTMRDPAILRACLDAIKPYGVPVYCADNPLHREICAEYGVPFQKEVYVDINYDAEGTLLPVSKSKMATPEDCANRLTSIALEDRVEDIDGIVRKVGLNGEPFGICLHSDMPTVLDNVKAVRKAVDEANAKRGFTA
ncbi:Lactam utilization protein lamB [Cladophialophora carrionii]|uniref:Lactam utilization protein lamB n=1 Tax=Cladophialophora carrionii TaxID=86049 RepID=A0A1C1D0K0_9EURO|nr:Lactam utilization protein lamB [Cladophialophora carrionii]